MDSRQEGLLRNQEGRASGQKRSAFFTQRPRNLDSDLLCPAVRPS